MKLQNLTELQNTRRKLADLEELIARKERSPGGSPAREFSLESMKAMARKLQSEIDEYLRAHQTA